MPNLPQPLYHFTNYGYGYEAEFHFNPEEPTSLLYKKDVRRIRARWSHVHGAQKLQPTIS